MIVTKSSIRRSRAPRFTAVALGLGLLVHCSSPERDFRDFDDGSATGDGDSAGDGDMGGAKSGDGDGDIMGDGDGDVSTPMDCTGDDDCSDQTPFCDQAASTCRGCLEAQECSDLDPASPYCVSDACVECEDDAHCGSNTPVCGADNACRGCVGGGECSSQACDVATGLCIAESDTVYALAQTGVTGVDLCGSLSTPCRFLDDAASLLTPTRNNLVLLPTVSEFTNYAIVVPPGVNANVFGNHVKIRTSAVDVISVSGQTVHLYDMDLAGYNVPASTLVRCSNNGDVSIENSKLASSGSGLLGDDCSVHVKTSDFRNFSGTAVGGYCEDYECTSQTMSVERSYFEDSQTAVSLDADRALVQNNVFVRIALTAYSIGVHTRGNGSEISFNTLYASGNCAFNGLINCGGGGTTASSNLTYANTEADGPCYDQVYSCGIGGGIVHAFSETTWAGPTNQNGDPKLVDPASGDFNLMSDSPAIDSGNPTAPPAVDFAGNPRTVGAAPDVGALEFQ